MDRIWKILHYRFQDENLLRRALTHGSASQNNNETLEFLGDAVLSMVVSDYLFRKFPDASAGELTVNRSRIVNKNALLTVAETMGYGRFIIVGDSFPKLNESARMRLLSDSLEAIIGAIYLDGGIDAVVEFIHRQFRPLLECPTMTEGSNFKSILQEYLQKNSLSIPEYETIEVGGEQQRPYFTVSCRVDGLKSPVIGEGYTVKDAEQIAAAKAYELLRRRKHQR